MGPAGITDLSVAGSDVSSVTLEWTAVSSTSAEGTTAVVSYDLRYSPRPILTESDFASATPVLSPRAPPRAPGVLEHFVLSDTLLNGQTYYFAIRAIDAATLKGPLSNSPSVDDAARQRLRSLGRLARGAELRAQRPDRDHRPPGRPSAAAPVLPSTRATSRASCSRKEVPRTARPTADGPPMARAIRTTAGDTSRIRGRHSIPPRSRRVASSSTDAGGQLTGGPALVVARFGDTRISGSYRLGLELIAVGRRRPSDPRQHSRTHERAVGHGVRCRHGRLGRAQRLGAERHRGLRPHDRRSSRSRDASCRRRPDTRRTSVRSRPLPGRPRRRHPAPSRCRCLSRLSRSTCAAPGALWAPGGVALELHGTAPGRRRLLRGGLRNRAVAGRPEHDRLGASPTRPGSRERFASHGPAPAATSVGYRIYRWQDAPDGALYTSPEALDRHGRRRRRVRGRRADRGRDVPLRDPGVRRRRATCLRAVRVLRDGGRSRPASSRSPTSRSSRRRRAP